MRFLFDPESQFMQFVSCLCDLILLNIVYLLTCIPLFTIGAATAALYDTVFRMDTEREGKLMATYFHGFRENFRQGTAVWLLLVLYGVATWMNMVRFSDLGGGLGYGLFVFSVIIILIGLFVAGYAFPLMSRFRYKTGALLQNSLLLSISYLPRTIVICIINAFPWGLLLVDTYTFTKLGFLWFALYFTAAAYFNSRVLKKVVDNLIAKVETEEIHRS